MLQNNHGLIYFDNNKDLTGDDVAIFCITSLEYHCSHNQKTEKRIRLNF